MSAVLSVAEGTALAALALNMIIAVVGLTWGLGKIRDTVRDAIDVHRKKIDEEIDTLRHEFGETVQAIRMKVTEVELWTRDNLVKKESFGLVTDRISREVRDLGERLDKRLERMEGKIDHP